MTFTAIEAFIEHLDASGNPFEVMLNRKSFDTLVRQVVLQDRSFDQRRGPTFTIYGTVVYRAGWPNPEERQDFLDLSGEEK